MLVISELRPMLKNGSGIPVFGRRESTTPMLTTVCSVMVIAMPEAMR